MYYIVQLKKRKLNASFANFHLQVFIYVVTIEHIYMYLHYHLKISHILM